MPDVSGPPKGSLSDSPYATQTPQDAYARRLGTPNGPLPSDNPAWQPPASPLAGQSKTYVKTVVKDLPIISTIHTWDIPQIRSALVSHMMGIFYQSGQLCDSVLGDDRIQATLGSLISGLFGNEVIFEPADDSAAAKECCDAWVYCWPCLAAPSVLTEVEAYSTLMGFEPAQLLYDTSVVYRASTLWAPYLRPWHPRYTYYNWDIRKLVAISQDGSFPVIPGDGKWVLHAPYGDYRGWIRGAIRAVATPWIGRTWGLRDWERYSEKHGIPITKAICPAASDPTERDAFEQALENLGHESTILLSRGVDGQYGFDVEYAEPTDDSWQSFPGLIDRCDMQIVLAIMFQNLTTEVKGGSFAATSSHMDIREGSLKFRDMSWQHTLREQIAKPFAWLNFGDPKLAPKTRWDVPRLSEHTAAAEQFGKFWTAVAAAATAGIKFTDADEVRKFAACRFGLKDLPAFTIGDPPAPSGGGGFGGPPEKKGAKPNAR